jgi:hypothetical protein
MPYLKTILVLLLTVCCLGTGFSQKSNKVEKMAMEKTEKLNQAIIAGDAEEALTAEQATDITAIYVKMTKDVRAVKKAGGEADAIKAGQKVIRKAAAQKINKEILTKEQRAAKRKGKE